MPKDCAAFIPATILGSRQQDHCRTASQCRTNESLVRGALQKRKLENLELRLRGESRAFRPKMGIRWAPETELSRANSRNVGTFPQSLPPRKINELRGWDEGFQLQDVAVSAVPAANFVIRMPISSFRQAPPCRPSAANKTAQPGPPNTPCKCSGFVRKHRRYPCSHCPVWRLKRWCRANAGEFRRT